MAVKKDILKNWIELNKHVPRMTLKELKEVLAFEVKNQNRKTFIKRLQQRINKKARPYDTV